MAVPEDALRACTATHKRYEEMVWCIGLNVGSIAGMLVHAPSTQADAPGHALVPFIASSANASLTCARQSMAQAGRARRARSHLWALRP